MRSILFKMLLPGLAVFCTLTQLALAEDVAGNAAPPPDEILLKNGSRILGTVTDARDGTVTIATDFAGDLSVAVDQIESMSTQEPVKLLLADDTVVEDQPLQVQDSQLVLTEVPPGKSYALEDLLVVNPEPWELGDGYDWTGLVSFALELKRGNSDTDELDYRLETYWRSIRDRYTLKLNGEIKEANGIKNAENWQVIGKYDYFLGENYYWGGNLTVESDEFKDLDLRYLIGPYIGRDFFTDPLFTLKAEVGASYVSEDFITADDNEYTAANWYLRMTSDYLGGDSQLYLDQRGIWNLEAGSDVVVDTTFGLSFPLLWSLEAAAEIVWEYDSGAVEGVEELDETYKFRIGYTW